MAELVGSDPDAVHFTSGSTESIQFAIAHAVTTHSGGPLRVALSTVEHRAVLDAVALHERREEISVRWLPVDGQARLDMEALQTTCQDGVDLVCVMAANDEVGAIYPIEEVVELANKAGARTLVDATQAVGKFSIQAQA